MPDASSGQPAAMVGGAQRPHSGAIPIRFKREEATVPFDSIISRADADALIPEEVASEVIAATAQQSVARELCRRTVMSSKVTAMPVLSALPVAYWPGSDRRGVGGDRAVPGGGGR